MDIKTKILLGELCEAAGAVLAVILWAILAWLFLVATPDQSSAEADLVREQMDEAKGR